MFFDVQEVEKNGKEENFLNGEVGKGSMRNKFPANLVLVISGWGFVLKKKSI